MDLDPVGALKGIQRTLRWLTVTTVVLFGLFFFVAYGNYTTSRNANEALCTLRGDLERRVQTSQDFLTQHPRGAFGFTTTQITKSIADQGRTIVALSTLDC